MYDQIGVNRRAMILRDPVWTLLQESNYLGTHAEHNAEDKHKVLGLRPIHHYSLTGTEHPNATKDLGPAILQCHNHDRLHQDQLLGTARTTEVITEAAKFEPTPSK